jgi:hypothetical protein
MLSRFIGIIVFCLVSSHVQAKGEDIKGIRLGMHRSDVIRALGGEPDGTAANLNMYPDHYLWCLSIAKVYPKNSCSGIFTFDEDEKLVWLFWMFDSSNYGALRDALREKYPKMRCTSTVLSNALNARFPSQECVAGDIEISQHSSSIESGLLQMIDRNWQRKEADKKRKERIKDL